MATIYTVGHGARSAAALVAILKAAGIATLIDVRAYPGSRRHPQFSKSNLKTALENAGIRYEWHGEALGGMRPSYIEHMQSTEFQAAAEALARREERICLMCAESDPAHCHRAHIADWLVAHGHRIIHLVAGGEQPHPRRLL